MTRVPPKPAMRDELSRRGEVEEGGRGHRGKRFSDRAVLETAASLIPLFWPGRSYPTGGGRRVDGENAMAASVRPPVRLETRLVSVREERGQINNDASKGEAENDGNKKNGRRLLFCDVDRGEVSYL